MSVLRRFYIDYGERLGGLAVRSFDEVERSLREGGLLTRFLDAVWPAPRPEQVVRQLLASRERLAEAADGVLDDDEQRVLRRAKSGWSDADLPLLDEARALLLDVPRYGHVIVDEAQDLTPMQLRMIARRAAGAFTLLGDVAQATGPVAVRPLGRPSRCSFRAASERRSRSFVMPTASRARSWPSRCRSSSTSRRTWSRHVAYRAGAEPPRIVASDSPLATAYEEAARLAGAEGLLAVIAPASLRGDPSEAPALFDDTRISVLTPREAKGMEFDHVIVVEPALIVEESVGGQGLRELYVALTRPTTTLVVVHALPLPAELRTA